MNRAETARSNFILFAVFLIPVVWAALLVAPSLSGGLPEILKNLTAAINDPFNIRWTDDSPKCVLFFIAAYGLGIGIYLSTLRNYRHREEHGSAHWGGAAAVCKKYRDKDPQKNKILTQNVRIGLDGRKHKRNLNVMVVGGSGSGKTRFYAKPNVMQANTSFVILDPKGEILRDTGNLLK
ncbi:MAG TPA: conjugal transfer protein TraG, partial [Firmicutes bacterium]|nr:conjugal transfer protein TraG [Bacillota bacterium]